jgi:hypothetical protein
MLNTTASAYELYQHMERLLLACLIGKDLYRVTFKVRLNDGREEGSLPLFTEHRIKY